MTWRYSATTVDVTPALGPLAGYLARGSARATGVHDRLTASLLWLAGADGSAVCWVALDALSLAEATATRIRDGVATALDLPAAAVLVCCSHTHSGPEAWRSDDAAIERLVHVIAKGAMRLPATAAPVTAGWAVVPDGGVGSNRYDPAGPHDSSVGVLSLRDADGAVVAVLADYACHPTVLGHANLAYSADYPAAARRVLRAGLAATEDVETPPVVLFLQGAAGDVSTRFTRRESTFAEVDRQGGILAGALLRGVLAGEAGPLGAGLVVRRAECVVPTRTLPDPAAARATLAEAERAWQADGTESPAGRIARTRYEGAQALVALVEAGLPERLALQVTVVASGEVAWVHLPVEPFTSFGLAIKAGSPFRHTRVVGYTDGYAGYLADAAGHAAGRYEALSSYFEPAAGDLLVEQALTLLAAART